MRTILKNYTDLIARNWIIPAIDNSGAYIETETETDSNKYFYLSYVYDKYEIRLHVSRDGSFITLKKYSLADLLIGAYKEDDDTLETRIDFQSEDDLLRASQKLESLLPPAKKLFI